MAVENEQGAYKSEEERQAAEVFEGKNFSQRLEETNIDFNLEKYRTTKELIDNFENNLTDFDSASQERINSALIQMLELHKDQKDRPDGSPYIIHPLGVANKVVQDFGVKDVELVEAALLHDSVEDQADKLIKPEAMIEDLSGDEKRSLALEAISDKYSPRVAEIIDHLSNPDFTVQTKSEGIDPNDKKGLQTRKNELYKEHVKEAIQDPDVLVIKLADFYTNALDLGRLPTETEDQKAKKEKLTTKYTPVFQVFIDRLSDSTLPCPISDKEKVVNDLNGALEKIVTLPTI